MWARLCLCVILLDFNHYWILSWARPCLFVILGLGALWILSWDQALSVSFGVRFVTLLDYFVGQTMSVRYVWIWDALLHSFVGKILSWAIPSRRSKVLSSGKGHSVDWGCGDGFGDLFVGFFRARFCLFAILGRGPDTVCSLFLDSVHCWILLWGQTFSVRVLDLGALCGLFRGPDPACLFFF